MSTPSLTRSPEEELGPAYASLMTVFEVLG
jgi:hypothetical protein